MKIKYHPSEKDFFEFYACLLKMVGLTMADVFSIWPQALDKTLLRFSHIRNKYYTTGEGLVFARAAHIGHSVLLIYELSRQAYMAGEYYLADRLFYLNNSVNGVNVLPEIELPLRSFCDHPNGAIIGRANFSACRSFSFSNNCTIGNSRNIYPTISGDLIMLPGCVLLGNTTVEEFVVLSNGSKIRDAGILRNCIVYGEYPNNIIKSISSKKFDEISSFWQELNVGA
jgi:serine O-acetyltransferase